MLGLVLGASVLAYGLSDLVGSIVVTGVFRIDSDRVSMEPREIKIDLGVVSEARGSKVFRDIAVLRVYRESQILFKPSIHSSEKDIPEGLNLAVSATVELAGEGRSYRVVMPCIYSIGPCYRILAIIPGYDAPMAVEPGEYRLTLTISWEASGSGEVPAGFTIEVVEVE